MYISSFIIVIVVVTNSQLKNNIVKKQVVMNKEFEGKSFITKPSVLLFDDFQVGDSYNKKVCRVEWGVGSGEWGVGSGDTNFNNS